MMRDVCSADNRSVEPTKITASQITTGRQYLNKNFIRRSEVGDRATVFCIDHLIPHFPIRISALGSAVTALLKIGNKQTALDRLPARVQAPKTRERMPGFERVLERTPIDQ
jgi:hypothetical protein